MFQKLGDKIFNKYSINFSIYSILECPEGFNLTEGGNTPVEYKDYFTVSSIKECAEKLKGHGLLYMGYYKTMRLIVY